MPKKVRVQSRPNTEVWFRNPRMYWKQMQATGAKNVIFDGGYLSKYRIDNPQAWMNLHFGHDAHWNLAVVTHAYCAVYNSESKEQQALWPVFSAQNDRLDKLVKLCADPERPLDPNSRGRERWDWSRNVSLEKIPGQQHVVLVQDLPLYRDPVGRMFYSDLEDIQADYPDVSIFLHGSYAWRVMFGKNFKIVDWEPRDRAARHEICLPTGTLVSPERLAHHWYWARLLGFSVTDLYDAGKRCEYNIKSALWAGSYYKSIETLVLNNSRDGLGEYMNEGAWKNAEVREHITQNSPIFTKRLIAKPGDRIVCDDCSLWLACKLYREGAVCALPGSKYTQIADLFKTRDSDSVVKGLGMLLEQQVARAENAAELEAENLQESGLDSELNKLMKMIWDSGVDLLKIIDPQYRTGAKMTVSVLNNQNGQRTELTQTETQQKLVQSAYQALEAKGHARTEITEDMIVEWIKDKYPGIVEQEALEA